MWAARSAHLGWPGSSPDVQRQGERQVGIDSRSFRTSPVGSVEQKRRESAWRAAAFRGTACTAGRVRVFGPILSGCKTGGGFC